MLDVAAGNGNATLAAARRFAVVTSTDYVPALLDAGRRRAEAERLDVAFEVADAEALPYADASFDVVLSTFGVMFTAAQEQAAGELRRVCRPGGEIFNTRCVGCHGSGRGGAPAVSELQEKAAAEVVEALTTGKMQRQGSGLSEAERKTVAMFVTKKPL